MVCVSNTGTSTLKVPIKDTLGGHQTSTVNLSPTKTVESLFNEVASLYRYEQHSVELSLQDVVTGESVIINFFFINYIIHSKFSRLPLMPTKIRLWET